MAFGLGKPSPGQKQFQAKYDINILIILVQFYGSYEMANILLRPPCSVQSLKILNWGGPYVLPLMFSTKSKDFELGRSLCIDTTALVG